MTSTTAEKTANGWMSLFSVRRALASLSIKERIAGLDELRGVAVLAVMFAHGAGLTTWYPSALVPYGMHGVYLFFIVSGYLITKILQGSIEKGQPLSTFYLRRFIRIWPLMIVALLAGALWRPQTAQFIPFNLLLMNNYTLASGIEQVFRTDVMWSLAIEEQFYLLWPFVMIAVGQRSLPVLLAGLIALGFCFDSGVLPGGDFAVIRTTHGCMQYIALGAAIALVLAGSSPHLRGLARF